MRASGTTTEPMAQRSDSRRASRSSAYTFWPALVRREVIRRLEVLRRDLLRSDEAPDVDGLRGLHVRAAEVLVGERHVLPLLVLVALDDVGPLDRLARRLVDALIADRRKSRRSSRSRSSSLAREAVCSETGMWIRLKLIAPLPDDPRHVRSSSRHRLCWPSHDTRHCRCPSVSNRLRPASRFTHCRGRDIGRGSNRRTTRSVAPSNRQKPVRHEFRPGDRQRGGADQQVAHRTTPPRAGARGDTRH